MIEPQYCMYCKKGRKCAIHFVDADNFKQINDTYGHERGDLILKRIAQVLLEKCRKDGYVYRYGGDEFIAFFPVDTDEDAQAFKEEVVAELAKNDIHVSIGVIVTDPAAGRTFQAYMKAADAEMYRVKALRKKNKEGA